MPWDCHSDSAAAMASCVLPDSRSQSERAGPPARVDIRATVAPGTSDAPRPGADSGRALNSSARAGTAPIRTGQ